MKIRNNTKKPKSYKIISKEPIKAYTKGEYVRLGNRLRNYECQEEIPIEDLEILQTLRTSYKDPLYQIFEILQQCSHEINKDAIVTYRVKRINSIISKLKRLEDSQLPRIEDIAGCRCILKDNQQVYRLKQLLSTKLHIKSDRNDYIENPKPDGYKSLHLIVQTIDQQSKPIEVQLRCIKDHNWATLVEITDLVYNTKIKELKNEDELGRILLLISKGFDNLDRTELMELIDLIKRRSFVEKINSVFVQNSIKVRKQWSEIERKTNRNFYLIQVDHQNTPNISSYVHFYDAERAYFEKFNQHQNHNIVLTHIPNAKFEQISKAYSNYTLTYHAFFQDLLSKLHELVKIAFKQSNIKDFCNHFSLFIYIYFEIAKLQVLETYALNDSICKSSKEIEWRNDIKNRVSTTVEKRKRLFQDIQVNKYNIFHWIIIYKMTKIWKSYIQLFESDMKNIIKK